MKRHMTPSSGRSAEKPTAAAGTLLTGAVHHTIAPDLIDCSPLNYRKHFSAEALEQFADELKQHGMIAPLLVRQVIPGRYELIAGERRLRAARIAEMPTVPIREVTLSDEEVIEIQLAENLQRENPHPLHEAQAIGQLQAAGKTIDEIATRLGRSKQFVYARLKLLQLIDAFQEMVLADVLSLKDAMEIAALSADSQMELFEDRAKKWKQQKGFQLSNLGYYINQYRYNLKEAPFNTKDKNLSPAAGACTHCAHNSATLKTLFPDQAKQAVCSNKTCYHQKCHLHFSLELTNQLMTYQPVALLSFGALPDYAALLREKRPEIAALPTHDYHDVARADKPEPPEERCYTYEDEEGEPELDAEEWAEAKAEYEAELQQYEVQISTGAYKVGLLVARDRIEPVYFSLEKAKTRQQAQAPVSAKQVQEAMKAGTATPELLQAEINRLTQREQRAAELDREKIQLTIHQLMTEQLNEPANTTAFTAADQVVLRLLVYQSLSYEGQSVVDDLLFPGKERYDRVPAADHFTALAGLTEEQIAWMVRLALTGKPESKSPAHITGYCLYQAAVAAGLPVATIEQEQAEKAHERQEKQVIRIAEIERKIKTLQAQPVEQPS